MWVGLNGGWSIRSSGYNNTVTNISVFGNGCGGIAVSGGDMVSRVSTMVVEKVTAATWCPMVVPAVAGCFLTASVATTTKIF